MRILITGASGQLGGYLLRELAAQGAEVVAWSGTRTGELFGYPLRPVDLDDDDAVAEAFQEAAPAVVIHAAAMATVSDCHRNPGQAENVNSRVTSALADRTHRAGARFLMVSTDLVFDGERGGYTEADEPRPMSVYGATKLAGERGVLGFPRAAVVRVSLLFGPTLVGRAAFFDQQLQALRAGKVTTWFSDEWRTPLGLQAAARALIALAQSAFEGLLHLGGPERLSRLDMGRRLAAFVGVDPGLVLPASRLQAPAAEPRPRDTSLDSSKWRALFPGQGWPTFAQALQEMAVR